VITTLQVLGMTCNGCVKHVTSALREVPGVTAVEVDLAAGRAKVVGEAPVPVLIAAVAEAGYEAAAEG
jgi:copper chaperone